ncbi:MAG: hydroxymethylbilane synthase [Parvularculaceae bacterium]
MKIGTRATAMALAQTGEVVRRLKAAFPGASFEAAPFTPAGDRDQISNLERHGGKGGAFVEEIRAAMRARAIDAAMHSLKDMPGDEETPGLVIAALLKRESAGDALVLHPDLSLAAFQRERARGLRIGTNSVRRTAYLRRLFPDADIIHYRGAADTRLKKLDGRVPQKLPDGSQTAPADAIVVARAGLERIGLSDRISYDFPFTEMLPSIGQGVIAVECAASNFDVRARLAAIDDSATRARAAAEREVLWILNGHCNSPIAGHAELFGDALHLRAAVLSEDGSELIEAAADGSAERPRELGRAVGLALLEKGARRLVERSRIAP